MCLKFEAFSEQKSDYQLSGPMRALFAVKCHKSAIGLKIRLQAAWTKRLLVLAFKRKNKIETTILFQIKTNL